VCFAGELVLFSGGMVVGGQLSNRIFIEESCCCLVSNKGMG